MVTSHSGLPDDDLDDWPLDERVLRYQLTYTTAVVARIADHPHLIAWAIEQGRYVDVTDGSWANPYPFGPNGSRCDSLDEYTDRLWSTAEMTAELPNLAGKVLGCDCTLEGAVCHADILVRAVDDRETCCRCGRVGDGRHSRQDLDDGLNYLGQCCDVCEREAMWPAMRAIVEGLNPLRGEAPGPSNGSARYLNVAQVEERLGLRRGALSRAKMPPADVVVGRVNDDGSLPRGTVRGWLPETIDNWAPIRFGRGARTDLHE